MNLQDKYRGKRKYIFKKWWLRWLIAGMDLAGTIVVRIITLGRGLEPKPISLQHPKRILVVRLDHIGDLLFIRPSLEALRIHYPNAQITLLVSTAGAELLQQESTIDNFIIWDAPWFNRSGKVVHYNQSSLIRAIRQSGFDLSLDLRGDLRHHILLARAGIPCRVGYMITGGGFLLHVPLKLPPDCHEVERNLNVVRTLGASQLPQTYAPLALNEEEKKQGTNSWEKKKWRVILHPAAGDPRKCWPEEYFIEVCRELLKINCQIFLIGTTNERDRAQHIMDNCPGAIKNGCGQTGLRQLAAIMNQANLFIGNDSGPAHLAMTQGMATIIMWSEINQVKEWGPWGETNQAVVIRNAQHSEAIADVLKAAKLFLKKT